MRQDFFAYATERDGESHVPGAAVLVSMPPRRFADGDRVRIDIPDETDPDHNQFHGRAGTVVETTTDEANQQTGDERDAVVYTVEFDDGTVMTFRWRDLRPL